MNLAYFRKSTSDFKTTINSLKKEIEEKDFQFIGDTKISKNQVLFYVCKNSWFNELLKIDKNLIGFLPCTILISKEEQVTVGMGNPAIMRSVSRNPKITDLSSKIEKELQKLIDDSAGVEPLKPKGVLLYSTTTCPYCEQEKRWLEQNNVEHKVIYVDQDRSAATKMVEATGQMGVPVTEILYEDNEPEYIVGFDKQNLSSILLE